MVSTISAPNRRRLGLGIRVVLLFSLYLTLTGCAHNISTLQASVAPMPETAVTVSLGHQSVSDLGSKPAMGFAHFDAELRNAILREGEGQILWDSADPDLVLAEVNLQAESASPGNFFLNFLMGMLSIAPPIGMIPEYRTSTYTLDYAIDDRSGRQVLAGRIQDKVEGSYSGMYIGRLEAESRLIEGEGLFLSEHAGRRLLSELRERNAQLAQAVAYARTHPEPTSAEKASAQKNRQARAQRRSSLFTESEDLITAKKYAGPPPPVHGAPGSVVPGFEPGAPAPSSMFAGRATRSPGGPPGDYVVMETAGALSVVPAAAAASATPSAPSVSGTKSRVLLVPPRISMGAANPMQDRILANSMRSALAESRELVSMEETLALVAAAAKATGDAPCSSDACVSELRKRANAIQVFSLEILRDGGGTQLVVHVSGTAGNDSRSKFCAGCDTAKLDEAIGNITTTMAETSRPMTTNVAATTTGAPGPAMMQPAAQPTSAGNTLMKGAAEAVTQCAAKIAAEQACSLVPGFGATACKIGVGIKFKGALCP